MWLVCHRSSSELRISVRTKLNDAATLSWLGLVKQVLPSKDRCWLASANGVVASSSPGEGRTGATDYCPALQQQQQQQQQQCSSEAAAAVQQQQQH